MRPQGFRVRKIQKLRAARFQKLAGCGVSPRKRRGVGCHHERVNEKEHATRADLYYYFRMSFSGRPLHITSPCAHTPHITAPLHLLLEADQVLRVRLRGPLGTHRLGDGGRLGWQLAGPESAFECA